MIDHNEALRRIIARAQEDAGFRHQLKADPRAAVASLPGIEIPATTTLSVLEDTPTHLHIVLPAADRPSDGALEDEALEMVAGGSTPSGVDNPNSNGTIDTARGGILANGPRLGGG
ncbi:NHLP leader peptide family RiPP precursor (plasmid) [Tistrella mobilis]|uniref:NHLP leader peptide family RiPP precursor n=1 Tax=Tistrella mobilis TaxID=171437 RepID=UPI0035568EF0